MSRLSFVECEVACTRLTAAEGSLWEAMRASRRPGQPSGVWIRNHGFRSRIVTGMVSHQESTAYSSQIGGWTDSLLRAFQWTAGCLRLQPHPPAVVLDEVAVGLRPRALPRESRKRNRRKRSPREVRQRRLVAGGVPGSERLVAGAIFQPIVSQEGGLLSCGGFDAVFAAMLGAGVAVLHVVRRSPLELQRDLFGPLRP